MTTPLRTPTPDELVTKALSTLSRAEPPADLADRAFAAAMRAPVEARSLADVWADLVAEIANVARFGAACAAGAAAVFVLVAATTDVATTDVAGTDAADAADVTADHEWVAAVLPFAPGESS